ncbi:MAG: carcinine hydrolase/isopenicillin-N N-acyltransferase family protein [Mycoplasmoidaceae bacterium]|nr:carcinine hydrolase/isopenicillin-N N-acyltransferase family protein [Mycoplasmoidaceae bacterium]
MKKKSKNLAKIIAPVALATGCLGILPVTSCSKMYTKPVKVADYLHEITYNDYREDTKLETIDEGRNFGCSSVRCGNFYGRNFDYVYNDTPEFIAHVKANKKKHRHESIAVCTHFGLRENKLNAGKYKRELELIPNLTMDGINDAGVICSSNVVSMEPNSETATIIPETQPGKENAKQLHVLFIPRYILDNANSAKDAVDLLSDENLNIKGNLNNKMNIHVMIADKNETYIVEFFRKKGSANNHFDVVAQQKSDSIDNPTTIMTNYYCNMSDAAFTNDEKFGVERYEMLK